MATLGFPFYLFINIIIFITLPTSNSISDKHYKNCISEWRLPCGNFQNIGYPFWGPGRPPYCGHPALKLDCPEDFPVLLLGKDQDVSFNVLNITVLDVQLKIELQAESNHGCPLHLFTAELSEIFSNSFMSVNFSNCPPGIMHDTTDSSAFYYNQTNRKISCMHEKSDHQKIEPCKTINVTLPWKIFNDLKDEYGKQQVTEILEQSFNVEYTYSPNCTICENSGGTCGSDKASEFMCYCKNGPSHDKCKSGKWKILLVVIVVPGFFVLVLLNIVGLCCYKKFKIHKPTLLARMISSDPRTSDLETGNSLIGIPVFSYSELQEATNNFDANKELGDGGFGIVYHGKLRDGREVAVKRLYEKNYKRVGQFMNEVEILTQLRHPNLVALYGCTSRHSRELLLVYEYIPNGTVADHLYGELSGSRALTWAIRMKIATETANALSYLHTSDIIHRDVKTNNILLDNNFSVKVADFGLSRLFPYDVTHVSTAPQGTPGYLDPEYHKCYQVTNKSDVYSFGVVLVELISSLPAVDISRQGDEINLSDYAMKRIQKGALDELVDQNLGYNSNFKNKRMMTLVAELAFQCLQQLKEVRPCMTEVHETLKRIENLDYEALEAEEMDETTSKSKPIAVTDTDIEQSPPSPSSVIDNWTMRSTTSNPSS